MDLTYMLIDEVIQVISNAFADTNYPGDDKLIRGALRRDRIETEPEQIQKFLRGKDWRELLSDISSMREEWSPFSFLTDQAFLFYLPAYMIAALSNYDALGAQPNYLLSALDRTPSSFDLWKGRLPLFSATKIEAVTLFLQCFHELHGEDFPSLDADESQTLRVLNSWGN